MNVSKEMIQKIAAANQSNPYVDITPYEIGVGMPIIHYPGFFARPGECIIYVAPAQTFQDKSKVVGYTGKSAGVNFRIAKGVTVRTGSSGGRPIRGTVRDYNDGDLIISNKRIVFIGKNDSFDIPVEKVSTVKMLDRQSFVLQYGRAAKNIAMDITVITYAMGFITYVKQEFAAGVDVYQKHQVRLTSEQLKYCDTVRQECAKVRTPKMKNNDGCLWTIVKVLYGMIILMVIGFIALVISGKGNQTSGIITDYTASELVELEGHPRIYDTCDEAKAFYNNVGDRRVVITDTTKKSAAERARKSIYDDDIILYMIKDSIYEEYIERIEINISDEEFADDMTIENASNIVASYLPIDFFDYYDEDASYMHEIDGATLYTYACRLNKEGVEHHNSVAPQYSMYYYVRIVEYDDGKHWKIITDIGAYGDKDKGWIEKYAKPWNAPFTKED